MIRRMTTISWTSSPPRPMTCELERSQRAKAKLSICDTIDRGRRNRPGALLIKREQRPIVAHILGVEDRHRPIVQNQPALFVPNGHDRMACLGAGRTAQNSWSRRAAAVVSLVGADRSARQHDMRRLVLRGFSWQR